MMGRYVLESGCVYTLGKHLCGLGERCLVLTDRHPSEEFLTQVADGIAADSGIVSIETMRLERPRCEKGAARELAARIAEAGPDIVVALGASKIIDLARAALRCLQPNRPTLALVPTIVASNACVGSLAVMYGGDGLVNGFWSLDCEPELVAVDPQLVAEASPRFLAAAIGDQVASSLEAIHCARYRGADAEGIEEHVKALEVLLKHGEAAIASVERHEVTPELLEVLRAVTFYTPEQSAASGVFVCHALGEILSVEPEVKEMHGEVVGALVPAELVAAGEHDDVNRRKAFLHSIGLPAGIEELGLTDTSHAHVEELCELALLGLTGQGSVFPGTASEMADAVLAQ